VLFGGLDCLHELLNWLLASHAQRVSLLVVLSVFCLVCAVRLDTVKHYNRIKYPKNCPAPNFENDCNDEGKANKKAVLSQGNRAMPQLFFSV